MAAPLKRGLEAEGFAVDVAGNGTRRPVAGDRAAYDAIVLDVMLPGINGLQGVRDAAGRGRSGRRC